MGRLCAMAGWRPGRGRRANFSDVLTSAATARLRRSRGTIGRPQATPGRPATAAGGMDGRRGARIGIPGMGKGLIGALLLELQLGLLNF